MIYRTVLERFIHSRTRWLGLRDGILDVELLRKGKSRGNRSESLVGLPSDCSRASRECSRSPSRS